MKQHQPVEIVTIGGGMTAAILASQILPTTSYRMVSIEQGPAQWTYPDFAHNHDALRFQNRYAMMQDLRRTTWTWRPDADSPALPYRQFGSFHPGQGVGGAMVHWTALTWRFLPDDFNYRSHNEDRYGADRLPEEMSTQDWPIGYQDLEPYYEKFEYDLGVSGLAGNLGGHIVPGGNPFEGPRQRPYPNPPLAPSAFGELYGQACAELGLHPFPTPSGILSRGWTDPYGNTRAGCLYCGFCTRYGCGGLLGFVWVTNGGPAAYAPVLFSAHVFQHLALVTLLPVLVALAMPVSLALRAVPPRSDGSVGGRELLLMVLHSRMARFLAHPVPAVLNVVVSMAVLYLTPLLLLSLRTPLVHLIMMVHMALAGYLFANVLVGRDPGPRRPVHPVRLVLLLPSMVFHTFFGLGLVSADSLLAGGHYAELPLEWWVDRLADQQVGGALFWALGEMPAVGLAVVIAVLWLRVDARTEARRPAPSQNIGEGLR